MQCCGRIIKNPEIIYLRDTLSQIERKAYLATCPMCDIEIIEVTWFDKTLQRYDKFRPKKNDRVETIQRIKSEPYIILFKNPKHGNKSNMSWLYQKNGNIYDFNGTLKHKSYYKQITLQSNALNSSSG